MPISRIVGVVPSSWGQESMELTLAALQATCAEAVSPEVVIIGNEEVEARMNLAARSGISRVWQVETPEDIDADEPDAMATLAGEALAQVACAEASSLILTPPGPEGEELAARLAHGLGGHCLGRCLKVRLEDDRIVAERSVWGGRKLISLEVSGGVAVACVRAGKPMLTESADPVDVRKIRVDARAPAAPVLATESSGESLPPVESSKLVISGGRGLNEEGFSMLEQLARSSGGTLGGSLPAVDAGLVPVVRQVGISGKFVSPELYFAVGISGTPQHMAGISPDTRILAINKDPEAPIFSMAEAGVVGEWQELLPEVLGILHDRE
ncbi:electron transfer flavoprotein subunit alpha/FixB family protein [Marinobacter pelagius]|uniref:electron transfer flavoprotein subunit alpha/FixB family protein n=1 Tax=Marinobacter sp. C7 TaxID=2951363 RepID=UPI001EF1440B|nr:electron transfer flavoprotein subunit alpha/FixB family protein [Marinobacter sp. C7]MCG7200269.1 electron transfer flavoprotein subunit alpha/FixB family protein [Marinobacter sp. C7]